MARVAVWLPLVVSLLCGDVVAAAPGRAAVGSRRMNLAFVLLSEPVLPKGEEIARAFASFAPASDHIRVGKSETKGKLAALELDLSPHGRALIAMAPMPIPNGEADEAARYSLAALGHGWKLSPHKAHLVVTVTAADGDGAVETLSRFTSLVAAVTQVAPAVGVYWGNAGATHDPKFFVATAREPGIVPRITLWNGVSVASDGANRVSLLSRGMKQLGLPDLLLTAPKADMGGAVETFFDLLAYLADRGTPLPDGDTVGRTDNERLPVHYVPSPIAPGERVWRVDLK